MESFITYLKEKKKGLYSIWYKCENIIGSNESKIGNWELTNYDNSNEYNMIEVMLISPEKEKSLFRIEIEDKILINFISNDTISQIYYLEENEINSFNFKVLESEDKYISIHSIFFKDYQFQKIMHFIK